MRKYAIIAISLIIILIAPALSAATSPDYTVHVKKGDWIKYNVKETGTPPPEFNITWGRIDIKSVQGENIHTDVLTGYANGTIYPENGITLNIATGAIGDGFFIPTNLQSGDKYNSGYEGNITITGFEKIEAGGAQRTVITGDANQTKYYWDKQIGIMVAATSNLTGCVMFTTTSATSLWQPQILGLDATIFYIVIIAVVIILVAIAGILSWQLKSRRKS
jgi:hypothetical protein